MNAPATIASISIVEATLEHVALEKLRPSPTHIQALRRARFDKKALAELADSIRKVGVLQPIVATPFRKSPILNPVASDPTHIIVAGERRWLAAKEAGLRTVPVSVRELTEEQVLEVQLIENLQREGLHELEEAEGYEELMKLKKINAEVVAGMVGKSRSYVYARTKLLALCPEARKAFYAGELDASRALLVARIGHHDTQRQATLDLVKGPIRYGDHREGGPLSYREAHKHVLQTYMLALKAAPFDPKDAALLPKAGACTTCPKRTGNQAELFGDVKNPDVCTDPKCFDDKRQALQAVERRRLEGAGKKVVSGDAAKKIFRDWESPDKWAADRMTGGYERLDATTYAAGGSRKVSELLGADFEPILLQHPATGQIVKVATQQAIAAAAAKRQKNRTGRSSAARQQDQAKPTIDDEARDLAGVRTFAAVHAKAPKAMDSALLKLLAGELWCAVVDVCRQRTQAELGAAFGWKLKPTYHSRKAPKEVEALKAADYPRFIICCLAALQLESGDEKAGIFKLLKVDPQAIEKAAREELKMKAEAEKAAKKPVQKVKASIAKHVAKAKAKKK